jgi:hypothetical protein
MVIYPWIDGVSPPEETDSKDGFVQAVWCLQEEEWIDNVE